MLGPNRCGKTTIILIILSLLKPTNGQFLINGVDIEKNKISLLYKINSIFTYVELPKNLQLDKILIIEYKKSYVLYRN